MTVTAERLSSWGTRFPETSPLLSETISSRQLQRGLTRKELKLLHELFEVVGHSLRTGTSQQHEKHRDDDEGDDARARGRARNEVRARS